MPGFLLDLDGTLYHGDRPIEGAAEFIGWLKSQRFPYLYVTNNSSRTPEQVAEHLRKVGIDANADEVLTSAQAAAMYMNEQKPEAQVYIIGETGLRLAVEEGGFRTDSGETADFVVQGIDRSFSYELLAEAVRRIRAGAGYVLTNPDHLLPWNGELQPGAGSISASIERASETKPVVIGKPSPIIMGYAIRKLGLPKEQIWVVGDNLLTDIQGGIAAQCRTALVLTGLLSRETVEDHVKRTGVQPELICDDLNQLIARLNDGLLI